MILADYHLHTDFSIDSDTPMEDMVKQAIALGLERICFTDHVEFDLPAMPDGSAYEFDPAYLSEISRLREQYAGSIKILAGAELGVTSHIAQTLEQFTAQYPFDFIIASSHVVHGLDPYDPRYWDGISGEEGLMRYFRTIVENVRTFRNFDTYGHIDYVIRYIPEVQSGAASAYGLYSYDKFSDILDEILKTLIAAGKLMEINTSGFKYGLGHPHPYEDVIKRYFELGGQYVTIGSDAHAPAHIAYCFENVRQFLLSIGIKEYAVFENRKPIFLPL